MNEIAIISPIAAVILIGWAFTEFGIIPRSHVQGKQQDPVLALHPCPFSCGSLQGRTLRLQGT